MPARDHCGIGLARDRITALWQVDRVACIAGKPAPTVISPSLKVGGAESAIKLLQIS